MISPTEKAAILIEALPIFKSFWKNRSNQTWWSCMLNSNWKN